MCKEDSNSKDIIKPLLRGKDIKRYTSTWERLWLIFTRKGIDITKYPAILTYLSQFKDKLEPGIGRKPGPYQWYEIQDNIAYFQEFEKPKIIWGNLTINTSFSYDTQQFYIFAPACILSTSEKWLVALLNSKTCNFYLQNTAIQRQGGFIEQKPMYVKDIPIPTPSNEIKNLLTQMVDDLLQLQKERNEQMVQALEILRTEYALKKVSNKLEDFISLGWNEFMEELEKQHTLFSLQQKNELNKWFRGKEKSYQTLERKIRNIDDSIDVEVYKLYHLSNNDIQIVLRSIQQINTPNNMLKVAA